MNSRIVSSPKRVFPLLYFCAYAYTLWSIFDKFSEGGLPAEAGAVNGAGNESVVLTIFLAMTAMLCIYMLTQYVQLELFEHKRIRITDSSKVQLQWIEWGVRFLLVAVIAIKILKFEVVPDMYAFLTVLSFLLFVWSLVARSCYTACISGLDVLAYFIIWAFSLIGWWVSTDPNRVSDFGLISILIAFLLTLGLSAGCLYILTKSTKDIWNSIKQFFK